MTERLMLLDSASLYFRAFYGVPDTRRSPQEPPTNAVRGFLDMIATLVGRYQPTHLVACWDNDWRPAFRVEAIPTYKTHRLTEGSDAVEESPELLTPQVPVIRDALAALGIARVGVDGYEADDVIGTLTHRSRGLHAGRRRHRRPRPVPAGRRRGAGAGALHRQGRGARPRPGRPGLPAERSTTSPPAPAYADLATLRGDASDGLPGVAGVGEKTAATLINRYGDLATLRRALADGDPLLKGAQRARLEAASDYLDVAPLVVRVASDAPVEEHDASPADAGRRPGAAVRPGRRSTA